MAADAKRKFSQRLKRRRRRPLLGCDQPVSPSRNELLAALFANEIANGLIGRKSGRMALEHSGLMNRASFGEAVEVQKRRVDQVGPSGKDKVAKNFPGSRGVHYAVTAESIG